MPPDSAAAAAPSSQAFAYRDYRFFWAATALTSFAAQIMAVGVGLQVYLLTRNAFYLGLVGLATFTPALLLVLFTGLVADRFNRRIIIAVTGCVEFVAAITLLFYSGANADQVWPVFVVLVCLGTARAFTGPAASSLAPNVVPPEALASAVSLNASAWSAANILGPVVGGVLASLSLQLAFGTAALFSVLAVTSVLMIAAPKQKISHQATSVTTLLAGFRYIWHEKVVLGAISLDLFAVLLGGATALMPIFALDVLHVGASGLGLLRAAPGIGAIPTALYLARSPIRSHAGHILFVFVALFGLFTVVFGLSQWIWLSFPMLVLMGACDMVSVSIRETLMQLWTPDEVRGRVNAVNSVFIGASNEVGEFRAGTMAAFIGAVAAVAIGGVATMAVSLIWSRAFPGLRKAQRLDRREA
ncbi:MAG TPA: MFS transporter [Devosia sp.]|jgi:MFS family permease|nr:MFS transporter [Devosia sp.]